MAELTDEEIGRLVLKIMNAQDVLAGKLSCARTSELGAVIRDYAEALTRLRKSFPNVPEFGRGMRKVNHG